MNSKHSESNVQMIASAETGVDFEALNQLYSLTKLEGVKRVAGFPSLQTGSRGLRGMAVVTEDKLHPHLLGPDLGCGMSLWKTNLNRSDADPDGWAALPYELERPWDGEVSTRLAEQDLHSTVFDQALGTLGDGSHFAELLAVDEVQHPGRLRRLGLSPERLLTLVHAGSAGMGYAITLRHGFDYPAGGVDAGSFGGREFLRQQAFALRWAQLNRRIIAERFISTMGAGLDQNVFWDNTHNVVAEVTHRGEKEWVHRRGAVGVEAGFVFIAGTRGTHSYLVAPTGETKRHGWSLPHSAGRRWSRQSVPSRARARWLQPAEHMLHNPLGGRIICHQRDVLLNEAPENYRSSAGVIADLEKAGLVDVIASFRPVLTYQTQGWTRPNSRSA